MTDPELPRWLSQARNRVRVRGPIRARDDWPHVPRIGELRLADPMVPGQTDPRIVLVIGVEPQIGVADVALVSNETEFASDEDVVIGCGASGLPFDLIVEPGIMARLWCIQLGRLVANLDVGLARAVRQRAMDVQTPADDTSRVVEDRAPVDQRSVFKRRERAELDALSADCQLAVRRHGSGSEVMLDPALFDPALVGPEHQRFERWLTVAEILVRSAPVIVPVTALESNLRTCTLDSRLAAGRRRPDAVRALLPLFERVLAERPARFDDDLEMVPKRSRRADAVERELMWMLSSASKRGSRSVRLLTVPAAWTGEFPEPMVMARVVTADRTELQIIRHNLEAGS